MTRSAFATSMLVAAVTAAGCGGDREPVKDGPANRTTQRALYKLRITEQKYLSHAPIMIAHAEGYFRDEGLDVEFVPALRSQETLVALVSGDVDVRPGPIAAGFLSAIAQNAPIRAVADEGYLPSDGCMYFGLVLRNGLDTAGSPPIKRLRTGSDSPSRFVTERLLALRNIPIEGIETLDLPDVVLANSLATGAIDAVATTEPTMSRLKSVSRRWLSGQQAAPDMQWGVIAFSERLLTTDRHIGVRFLRAYRRGVAQFSRGKTPRNVAILAKGTGDAEDVIRAACWPSFRPDSRINWASVDEFQAWARGRGLLQRTVTQAQVWDSSFLVATDSAVRHLRIIAR